MNRKTSALVTPITSLALGHDDSLNVVIETPKGSRNEFKFDQTTGMFKLSKVLPEGMMFALRLWLHSVDSGRRWRSS